ncbi:L,D-transpeptidase [Actinoplanes utahensis]|uniref:L,D-transpeptidase n=1 Tax=Actinoplanes utahensis TaxID=1869 RepID=UPI00194E773B|nr:L,D-transpeptidase [Actinoplanes utahensis]
MGAAAMVGLSVALGATDVASLANSASSSAAPAGAVAAAAGKPFVMVIRHEPASAPVAGKQQAATNSEPASEATAAVPCATGPGQRAIEESLAELRSFGAVTVNGRQSPGDCLAIRAFQHRFGIEPAQGQADATTADVASRIAASSSPQRLQRCDPGPGVTACVDLTLQTAWVMRDGAVVAGPTVVRTGFRGHATPAGVYRINKRADREWSDPYEVWLPFWQRFVGGIGFHETTTYLHDATRGSHGCVNLLHRDAVQMWDQLSVGATVHTFGRRPGT